MSKIRVLEVCYGFGYGGIRAFIMNCLEHIDKEKYQIDIYAFGTCESPFTEKVKEMGGNIYFETENDVHRIFRFISKLKLFMKKHGPYDVVHANCNLISAWVLLAAKLAGVPVRLSHSHSANHFDGGIIQKSYSYLRRFVIDKLATTKLACGQLAGEKMYGKNASFTIINNGIDVDRFIQPNILKIAQLRESLNIPDGVKVYANVTRLDSSKNHLFALDVFKEIHKIEPDAILVIGGTNPKIGSTERMVRVKIEEYGLNEYVRFIGPVMEVEHLYHLSSLWIYCSTFEGLPFGPIELQAASVPCLASDVITNEIDLGLGLVYFLSLDESPQKWAQKAVSIKKENVNIDVIKKSFIDHQFDIKESVKTFVKIIQE